MQVPEREIHFGKLLAARTRTDGIKSDGLFEATIRFVGLNGDVEEIGFHFFDRNIFRNTANWTPNAKIFVVSEQFLKYGLQGEVFVRANSPSAVQFICETEQERLEAVVGAIKW